MSSTDRDAARIHASRDRSSGAVQRSSPPPTRSRSASSAVDASQRVHALAQGWPASATMPAAYAQPTDRSGQLQSELAVRSTPELRVPDGTACPSASPWHKRAQVKDAHRDQPGAAQAPSSTQPIAASWSDSFAPIGTGAQAGLGEYGAAEQGGGWAATRIFAGHMQEAQRPAQLATSATQTHNAVCASAVLGTRAYIVTQADAVIQTDATQSVTLACSQTDAITTSIAVTQTLPGGAAEATSQTDVSEVVAASVQTDAAADAVAAHTQTTTIEAVNAATEMDTPVAAVGSTQAGTHAWAHAGSQTESNGTANVALQAGHEIAVCIAATQTESASPAAHTVTGSHREVEAAESSISTGSLAVAKMQTDTGKAAERGAAPLASAARTLEADRPAQVVLVIRIDGTAAPPSAVDATPVTGDEQDTPARSAGAALALQDRDATVGSSKLLPLASARQSNPFMDDEPSETHDAGPSSEHAVRVHCNDVYDPEGDVWTDAVADSERAATQELYAEDGWHMDQDAPGVDVSTSCGSRSRQQSRDATAQRPAIGSGSMAASDIRVMAQPGRNLSESTVEVAPAAAMLAAQRSIASQSLAGTPSSGGSRGSGAADSRDGEVLAVTGRLALRSRTGSDGDQQRVHVYAGTDAAHLSLGEQAAAREPPGRTCEHAQSDVRSSSVHEQPVHCMAALSGNVSVDSAGARGATQIAQVVRTISSSSKSGSASGACLEATSPMADQRSTMSQQSDGSGAAQQVQTCASMASYHAHSDAGRAASTGAYERGLTAKGLLRTPDPVPQAAGNDDIAHSDSIGGSDGAFASHHVCE